MLREATMPCYVMLEFTAKPGTGPAMLDALREALPETRNKPGCESLEVTVNQDNGDNILLVMRWTSRGHYQTYRDWREANGDVQRFADLTVGGLSTRFFEPSGV
jgi:quinol monooxygenase YgiN